MTVQARLPQAAMGQFVPFLAREGG